MKEFEENDNKETEKNDCSNNINEENNKTNKDINNRNFGNNKQYTRIKMSFFRKLKVNIFDFDKYYLIASESIFRSLLFLVQLFLIFSLIVSYTISYKIARYGKDICNEIANQLPDFYFREHELICDIDEPVIIEDEDNDFSKFKIIFDNNEEVNKYAEQLKEYDGYAVAFNKYDVTIKFGEDRIETYEYSEINIDSDITKSNIVEILTSNQIYVIIYIYVVMLLFIIYFLSMLLDILALSVLGLIITRLIRLPLSYSSVFSISVASTTLPIILNLLYMIANVLWDFKMPKFQVMITLISYIYLIMGILILKSKLKTGKDNTNLNLNKNVKEEKGT